ncbi:MAG TPA: sugar transferase [Bryobacteraceae bacterium]|nr:sugar transferase [Bryobacteraceae bacterium]
MRSARKFEDRLRIPPAKRALDLILCSLALILLGPMMLLAAALIKLSSPGPVFYHAMRAGYKGQPFAELKFRTMHLNADRHGSFTAKDDPRVFPVGRFLRLFKIDEMPQILNILRGEMSIVGPRPEDTDTVEKCYSAEQRRVLDVAPGLTGFPQVRFFPELSMIDPGGMDPQEHYRRAILPMRLEMDLEYVRRQSLWLDIYLIAYTIFLVAFKSWWVLLVGQKTVSIPHSTGVRA